MVDLEEKAHRLKVLWEKGRNMYSAFFSELSEVKDAISPDEFPRWCIERVGVGLKTAIKASEVLKAADEINAKQMLKHTETARKAATQQAELDLKVRQSEAQLKIARNLEKIRLIEEAQCQLLQYVSEDPEISAILDRVKTRDKQTPVEYGKDFILLREILKAGRMGKNPDTGKKWVWSKWAPIALRRGIRQIQRCIKAAEEETRHDVAFPGNYMKTNGKSDVIDNVYQ